MSALEVLSSHEALRALRGEWEALCDVAARVTPFQRPGWVLPWMEHFDVSSPRALAVRCGRDLVGLVPAFSWGDGLRRNVSLLGVGVSDHLDALWAPGFERAILDAASGWLEDCGADWDTCAFDELGPKALLRDVRCPRGARVRAQPQSVCPVLVAAPAETELERVVPRRQAEQVRRARRRSARAGVVELGRADRLAELGRALEALVTLHTRRWERRGEAGALTDRRIIRFHQEVAIAFATRRALRLYVLRIDRRDAAVIYGFRERERVHLYLQGISPDFDRSSPGTILLAFVVEDALAEGVREFDFLRGSEPYKYAWGAVDEVNVVVRISR
jgi:CelD/BcsL family acetyltransferase involved in cellulose biosynthesis